MVADHDICRVVEAGVGVQVEQCVGVSGPDLDAPGQHAVFAACHGPSFPTNDAGSANRGPISKNNPVAIDDLHDDGASEMTAVADMNVVVIGVDIDRQTIEKHVSANENTISCAADVEFQAVASEFYRCLVSVFDACI